MTNAIIRWLSIIFGALAAGAITLFSVFQLGKSKQRAETETKQLRADNDLLKKSLDPAELDDEKRRKLGWKR